MSTIVTEINDLKNITDKYIIYNHNSNILLQIYQVTDEYYDTELLKIDYQFNKNEIALNLEELHKLNIVFKTS